MEKNIERLDSGGLDPTVDKRSMKASLERIYYFFFICGFDFIQNPSLKVYFLRCKRDYINGSKRFFLRKNTLGTFLQVYHQHLRAAASDKGCEASSAGALDNLIASDKFNRDWHAIVFLRHIALLLFFIHVKLEERLDRILTSPLGEDDDSFMTDCFNSGLSDCLAELEGLCRLRVVNILCFKLDYLDGRARRLILSLCDILEAYNTTFGFAEKVLSLRQAASGLTQSDQKKLGCFSGLSSQGFSRLFKSSDGVLSQSLLNSVRVDEKSLVEFNVGFPVPSING